MLNTILNTFFGNIRTLVAAGIANAIKLGVSDALQIASETMTLELKQPDEVDAVELQVLSIESLIIE